MFAVETGNFLLTSHELPEIGVQRGDEATPPEHSKKDHVWCYLETTVGADRLVVTWSEWEYKDMGNFSPLGPMPQPPPPPDDRN